MEEKKSEVKDYLETVVNPILKPMVQEIAKQRPKDILAFVSQYSSGKLVVRNSHFHQSSDSEEDTAFQAKLLEKKKKKKVEKKMSRQGISAQVFGTFNQKTAFVPKNILKNPKTEEYIRKLLLQSILFQNLNKEDTSTVIRAMEEIEVQPGQQIIKEGDEGNTLYLVGDGQYQCYKIIEDKETYLKTYNPGEAFGELSLMYNTPRAASIKAKTAGKLYGLDRATFSNIVQESAIKKRTQNLAVLSRVKILKQISSCQKEQLCDALKEQQFEVNQYIVRQGEEGNRFYILAEGEAIAEKQQAGGVIKKVFEYKKGDYFGQIALLNNTKRQASIKAVTTCRIVSIDREAFKRLLGPIEDILQRNIENYTQIMSQ